MRAIIIQEADASNLLDLLKLEEFQLHADRYGASRHSGIPLDQLRPIIDDVHAKFHYIVCRWLQEQGATCVR